MQNSGSRLAELDRFEESDKFTHREKLALRYTDAIVWNPASADDEMWKQLHEEFTEPELVELGYWIGFTAGGQRWLLTLATRQGELAAALNQNLAAQNQST
ncbi:MAG: hypothetical protein O6837_14960 [Deltaproteobacteria bacterium]|nr:hypothetical protein [Deltaproteobacteria bacterium]